MLHYLFALLLLVHALIHLMGFAKAFKLADIKCYTGPDAYCKWKHGVAVGCSF